MWHLIRRFKFSHERKINVDCIDLAYCIVLPSTGVKADVYLQCVTALVMGGNGLSRPGGNLGFRV